MVSTLFRWPCRTSIHGLSLLVSALFRWPCSIFMRLSPRSVAAGVRCHWWCPPFSAGHVAFLFICLFVSQVCHCWCPPFSAGDATFLFICLPSLSLVVSAPGHEHFYSFVSQVCHCWCPPFAAGHAAFQFVCL